MSEDQKTGGAGADESGAQSGTQSKEKQNSNSELDRVLKDLHKFKSQAKDYEAKLAELEQGKMLAEGKKDDLIATLQKQITELKTKNSEMRKTYAWDKVENALKTKAIASGILQDGGAIEKFTKLIDFKGRNPFIDDETFKLDDSVLGQVFDDAKREMPYFFGKPSPNLKDVTPSTKIDGGTDFSKMSLEQMKQWARENPNA